MSKVAVKIILMCHGMCRHGSQSGRTMTAWRADASSGWITIVRRRSTPDHYPAARACFAALYRYQSALITPGHSNRVALTCSHTGASRGLPAVCTQIPEMSSADAVSEQACGLQTRWACATTRLSCCSCSTLSGRACWRPPCC